MFGRVHSHLAFGGDRSIAADPDIVLHTTALHKMQPAKPANRIATSSAARPLIGRDGNDSSGGRGRLAGPDDDGLDVPSILSRQKWLIAFLTLSGLALGIAYAMNAQVYYRSEAKVLINQKSAGLSGGEATDLVAEETLANHMELLKSGLIVREALAENGLMELESLQPYLTETNDAADYVIDRLELVKGGDGAAKSARSLNIALTHTDAEDVQLLLTAVLKRYEKFIVNQVEQLMGRANDMVQEAKNEVETELIAAEQEYLTARQEAPLFFQGEGSSNVYQDRYRRLQEELLDMDIRESTLRTRVENVQNTLEEMDQSDSPVDQLDKLALIDSESLQRLGVFAGLQMNSANTAEFKASMPVQAERARAEFTQLLQLQSEKQRLVAIFGAGHPKVQDIEREIATIKEFLQDNDTMGDSAMLADTTLTPEGLLRAYVGFLQHDLTSLEDRRRELTFLAADAEEKAKELIEYELRDLVLQKKIERQEALFDGIVTQLRELDTASGLSGYLYEFLEIPDVGEKSWPRLPLCALGGLMMGLFGGLVLAVGSEVRDGRFRSAAELDEAIGLPNLGMAEKLNNIRQGVAGLKAVEASPASEAFRLGRTVLLPKIRSGELKTIGFTSPMQGDGKSTFLSNFAASLSQIGLRVLVIDADMRRPSVHRYFSVGRGDGLYDILTGKADVDDALNETEIDNVTVLTSGSDTKNPAELLQSDRLDELLADCANRFDVVLVDLPPVLAVSDPVVVMPRLDGGVLVVNVARVRRDEVVNTMRRIESSGGDFVGCFLNARDAGGKFKDQGGYYGYYRSDYSTPTKSNGVNGSVDATPNTNGKHGPRAVTINRASD